MEVTKEALENWPVPPAPKDFWANFDLDKFFKDAQKVGEILRETERKQKMAELGIEPAPKEELPPLKDKKVTQEDIDHACRLLREINATPKEEWRYDINQYGNEIARITHDFIAKGTSEEERNVAYAEAGEKLHSKVASLLAEERDKTAKALRALGYMWNQYCGTKGHLYMSAGEAASEVLMENGLLADEYSEIDYQKLDDLLASLVPDDNIK